MEDGMERLNKDLIVLEAMAAEMDIYLREEILFWHMSPPLPALTLGGYLMRQHRLLALRHLLADAAQRRLATAVSQFNAALQEKVVRTEAKVHAELPARIRQWAEYVREEEWREEPGFHNYGTAVETRAMISALVDMMAQRPYQLQSDFLSQIKQVDTLLRATWIPGPFIWPQAWQPAYPLPDYWWLYGPGVEEEGDNS